MHAGFEGVLDEIEDRRRVIEVYSPSAALAGELAGQFATKNVSVSHVNLPASADEGFLILRSPEGEFEGTIGVQSLERLLSPEHHPPWVIAETDVDYGEIFDFLDDTLFSSFDRSQMLATTREIEERAWRVGGGTLYTGFQREAALDHQVDVYEQLASHGKLSVQVFVDSAWDVDVDDRFPICRSTADEIGRFWFVVFDGAGSDLDKCGLIAEERGEGTYYGFWTYDPAIVDDIVEHLETTCLDS